MLWNEITFGVEIECYIPSGANVQSALIAAGVEVSTPRGSIHATTSGWKIVGDGSLNGQAPRGTIGQEIVSPILMGEDGIRQVKAVCAALQGVGARINTACGLHVHVGARSATVGQIANLAKLFIKYESQFDSLVPEARRANNNRFCQSNTEFVLRSAASARDAMASLGRAQTVRRIAEIMNGGFDERSHYTFHRYFKMNLQSYATHGTVEFRQHSGSVDGEKIAAWVRLVTGFTANAFTLRAVTFGPAPFDKLMRKVDRKTAAYLRQRRTALDRRTAAAAR